MATKLAKDVVEITDKNGKYVGNNNPTGKNQYSKSNKWYGDSYEDTKTKLKIYYEFHPECHMNFIESVAKNAAHDIAYAKLAAQMTGGFDPVETKDVTPKEVAESPLNGLTVEELRTLKALKKGK